MWRGGAPCVRRAPPNLALPRRTVEYRRPPPATPHGPPRARPPRMVLVLPPGSVSVITCRCARGTGGLRRALHGRLSLPGPPHWDVGRRGGVRRAERVGGGCMLLVCGGRAAPRRWGGRGQRHAHPGDGGIVARSVAGAARICVRLPGARRRPPTKLRPVHTDDCATSVLSAAEGCPSRPALTGSGSCPVVRSPPHLHRAPAVPASPDPDPPPGAEMASAQDIGGGWTAALDPGSGRTYYINQALGTTQVRGVARLSVKRAAVSRQPCHAGSPRF